MIIQGAIVCENCNKELQPNNLGMRIDENGNIVRVCIFCKHEVVIDGVKK